MTITLFRQKQDNTGVAFSFSIGYGKTTNEPCLFITSAKQNLKTGKFEFSNAATRMTLKASALEAGSLISCYDNETNFEVVHSSDKEGETVYSYIKAKGQKTSFKKQENGKEVEIVNKKLFLRIGRGKIFSTITLNEGESEYLKQFFIKLIQLHIEWSGNQRNQESTAQTKPQPQSQKQSLKKQQQPEHEESGDENENSGYDESPPEYNPFHNE